MYSFGSQSQHNFVIDTQESSTDSRQKLLVLFSVFHLLAMTSVITNPIMYGLLNFNYQQVNTLTLIV